MLRHSDHVHQENHLKFLSLCLLHPENAQTLNKKRINHSRIGFYFAKIFIVGYPNSKPSISTSFYPILPVRQTTKNANVWNFSLLVMLPVLASIRVFCSKDLIYFLKKNFFLFQKIFVVKKTRFFSKKKKWKIAFL